MAVKRYCPICCGYHAIGQKCYKGQIKKDTEASRFRNSRKWQNKTTQIKERDNYMCVYCRQHGRYNTRQLEVHHIVPLCENIDLGLEDENLVTLCNEHHRMAERGEIPRQELQQIVMGYYEEHQN